MLKNFTSIVSRPQAKGNEDFGYEIGIDTCILFLLRGLLDNDDSFRQGLLNVIKMAVRCKVLRYPVDKMYFNQYILSAE